MPEYLWVALAALLALSLALHFGFLMPRKVRAKWRRLARALEHLKNKHASEEDMAVIDEARRLGLLKECRSRKGHDDWHVYYAMNGHAHDLCRSGRYPKLEDDSRWEYEDR